jgi:hypothetical protein
VREALKPFISFSDGTMFSHLPDDFVLTAGSRLAHRQLTAGDFRSLRTALASSGNAGALEPVTVEREKIARIIHDVELAQEGKRPISDGDWNALKNIKRLSSFCFAAADAIRALIGQPAPASNAKESRLRGGSMAAQWTYDPEAEAYYFAPMQAALPPYLTQRHVDAIIDIASDGTLAGVELIDNMPPPPTALYDAPALCASKAVSSTDKIDAQNLT